MLFTNYQNLIELGQVFSNMQIIQQMMSKYNMSCFRDKTLILVWYFDFTLLYYFGQITSFIEMYKVLKLGKSFNYIFSYLAPHSRRS